MKLTVNRETWRCGADGPFIHGKGETVLLNKEGFMCCLGHCSLQLGATKEQIFNKVGPSYVLGIHLGPLHEKICRWASDLSIKAMSINDNNQIDNTEREKQLITLFTEHNIELTFEGVY